MKYLTKIKDTEIVVEIERVDDHFQVQIDGDSYHAEMFQLDGAESYLFRINNEPHQIEITKKDHQYSVSYRGDNYLCHIEDERLARLRSSIKGSEQSQTEHVVSTPMPGLIVEINVAVGQEVRKGESLLTIEAMKMENEISAPEDAVVTEINVAEKQAVEMGQELLVLEYIE
ncbi:biotin/lipoyl-binding protein [candidate division KSB1 bacterium]|nr:biotin/lipoyl-binding protein [candidate division KSB1 bacterium]